MRVARLSIKNYRGIKEAVILLSEHGVLIGDNNSGKTTILEAPDLGLGPDCLNRQPPIDEHDFFRGAYAAKSAALEADGDPGGADKAAGGEDASQGAEGGKAVCEAPRTAIEVTIVDLTEEQKARFGDCVEFWDLRTEKLYDRAGPSGVDPTHIAEALRITLEGWHDEEEDDFEGRTSFSRSLMEGDRPVLFSRKDKQVCGFLFPRQPSSSPVIVRPRRVIRTPLATLLPLGRPPFPIGFLASSWLRPWSSSTMSVPPKPEARPWELPCPYCGK